MENIVYFPLDAQPFYGQYIYMGSDIWRVDFITVWKDSGVIVKLVKQ